MPQNPLQATVAVNTSGQQAPLQITTLGEAKVVSAPALSVLALTAAQVVKTGAGRVGTANVVVAGSAAGGLYDCLTTAQINVTNQICVLPTLSTNAIGVLKLEMPFQTGLVAQPGTGQTISLSYE
jgi:hypothetical protein